MHRARIWRDLAHQAEQLESEELLAFFQKRRNDKWTPAALTVLLERLPPDATNTPEFLKVLQDVIRRLPNFSHQELPRMLQALSALNWRDKGFYKTAEDFVLRSMPLLDIPNITIITHCFVKAQCGSRELFNMCIHKVAQEEQVASASDVATLAWSFSRNSYKPFQFLTGISPSVAARCPEFTSEECVLVLGAYAQWPRTAPAILLPTVLKRNPVELLDMEQGLVVRLLQSLANIYGRWRNHKKHTKYWDENGTTASICEIFIAAASRIEVQKLDRKSVSRLLWAYARVNVFPPEIIDELEKAALKIVKHMPIDDVAAAALSLAKYRQNISSFHAAAEPVIDKQIKDATERDLASIATAYALAATGSPQLFALLQDAVVEKEFPAEQLSSLLWSFATVRLNPKVFQHLQVRVLEVLHNFTAPAVCDVLWAFDVVRMMDEPFFDACMKLLRPSVVHDSRCALLYPAMLNLPFMDKDPETMNRYRAYMRPYYWEWQRTAPGYRPAKTWNWMGATRPSKTTGG
eukprot:GEMP01021712.1.p1 GENE.GEMP01021712.1~~GEMP01021712.1.p1  ORF type:complete len:520 (+),score=105.53 GEMP01021712.1:265-1824(+)